jgi:ankyrin repeat protein
MSEDERMAQIAYRNFTTTCRGTPLKTRLLDAAISQDDALFILLLKKHPDLANEQNWATDPLFNNALHRAVGHKEQDNSDLVYAWLEAGGPVTAQTSNGETALNIACRAGNYSCANMLFEWHRQNSIPTEDRNAQGLAPLHYVLSYKHPQPPAQGASHLNNPNESPDLAEKIVMYMDAWGTSEWRDLGHRMIQSMGDVNIPIARSLTPLHCVVAYKKINDTQDPFGLSLYIPLLMQRGADINRQTAPDDGGETIFHIIARRNDRELLDSLFTAQGASLPLIAPNAVHWQLQNAQGKTALQVATESGHAELATRLAALSAQGN